MIGGGVSFRRQQSESGGDGTNTEANADNLGRIQIFIYVIKLVPMSKVDLVHISRSRSVATINFGNFDAVHDMGMEVRENEEAFGGFGFLASALGEGYFF